MQRAGTGSTNQIIQTELRTAVHTNMPIISKCEVVYRALDSRGKHDDMGCMNDEPIAVVRLYESVPSESKYQVRRTDLAPTFVAPRQ